MSGVWPGVSDVRADGRMPMAVARRCSREFFFILVIMRVSAVSSVARFSIRFPSVRLWTIRQGASLYIRM